MRIGITVLRSVIGLLFMGHGLQKLKGWFGGHGPDGTAGSFDKMGLRPAKANAVVAGATETTAGALLLTGALTPVATSMVTGTMATAIRRVSGRNGVWITKGGYEYNAVLIAAAFAIAAEGPGRFSVDEALGIEKRGLPVAAAQLAVGLAGAAAVEVVARVASRPQPREVAETEHEPFPEMPSTVDLREPVEAPPPFVREPVSAYP